MHTSSRELLHVAVERAPTRGSRTVREDILKLQTIAIRCETTLDHGRAVGIGGEAFQIFRSQYVRGNGNLGSGTGTEIHRNGWGLGA